MGHVVLLKETVPIGHRLFAENFVKYPGQFGAISIVAGVGGVFWVFGQVRPAQQLAQFGEAAVVNAGKIEPLAVGALVGIAAGMAAV